VLGLARREGDLARTARLFYDAWDLHDSLQSKLVILGDLAALALALAGVREAIEADALSRAGTAGAAMSLDEAVRYARSIVPP